MSATRAYALHLAVIVALFAIQFALPAYHYGNVTRIMLYAVFAIGYNILLGYTGLLSLGHALFFAAGAYGAGLAAHWWGSVRSRRSAPESARRFWSRSRPAPSSIGRRVWLS